MLTSIPRAFLSHTSIDKTFVSSVSNRLGRHRVAFDQMHFDSGYSLINEIEKHLHTSQVFVFFASPMSLKSYWCTFEVDAAKLAVIRGVIRRSITYIISNKTSVGELPAWLRESRVIIQPSVGQVVRDIDHHLMTLLSIEDRPVFVGRNALKSTFLEDLIDPRKRQVFVFSGLEAIGRRSYARSVLEENLALRPGPTVTFDPLSGPDEIYAQLLTDSDVLTPSELKAELAEYSKLSDEQRVDEVVAKIANATGENEYPVFVEHGGLTDKMGEFHEFSRRIIDQYVNLGNPPPYLSLITRRKPRIESLRVADVFLHQTVPPLTKAESIGLLRRVLSSTAVGITETDLQKCADLTDGYPPAVFFVARFVQKYGVSALLHSPDTVEALKRKVFVKFLRDLSLESESIKVLRYLAREGSLQFSMIGAALDLDESKLAPSLLSLIDLSLVTYEAPHYGISRPIRDSVIRVWGELSSKDYIKIADNIAVWTSKVAEIPDIDTIDALLSAQVRGGKFVDWSDSPIPILPSSMVKLAERCYHQRDNQKAHDLSVLAEQYARTRPQRLAALAVRAKALSNLQHWSEAEVVLDRLDKEISRDRFYLRGFMLRKRHKFLPALTEYEKAIHTGHNPNSVLRDSADCLFRLGRYREAVERITTVRERDPDNPFVLDLLARCQIDLKDDVGAKVTLDQLRAVDTEDRFWSHRQAAYSARKGNFVEALKMSEAACKVNGAPFECFSQRADIAIEMADYKSAKTFLENIRSKFGSTKGDVQDGLWCKYFLAQNKWAEAESFWDKLADKDLRVHRSLRLRILDAKARDFKLSLAKRGEARQEAENLRHENTSERLFLTGDTAGREEVD